MTEAQFPLSDLGACATNTVPDDGFPRVTKFSAIRFKGLPGVALRAVAISGAFADDQMAAVGPDTAGAMRAAVRMFGAGAGFIEAGAQEIVMLSPTMFNNLIARAHVAVQEDHP